MKMNEQQPPCEQMMDKLAVLFRPKPQPPHDYKLTLSELIRRKQFTISFEGKLYEVKVKKMELIR